MVKVLLIHLVLVLVLLPTLSYAQSYEPPKPGDPGYKEWDDSVYRQEVAKNKTGKLWQDKEMTEGAKQFADILKQIITIGIVIGILIVVYFIFKYYKII
jgi:hypothetical protein